MAALNKMFKNLKNEHILGIVGLVFLVFVLYQYTQNKDVIQMGMTGLSPGEVSAPAEPIQKPSVQGAASSNTYAPFNGANAPAVANSATTPAAANKPIANPADLLPSDSNSSWANLNPVGDLKNVNLLNPTQLVGINTQGSSLRNANLQLRSEPPNPRTNTNCPWNVSTIEDDKFRKPLEIGTAA